ncbi:uncharacterized protein LOC143862442 isoform X2 [Tasmannia lanceolata]|uniref:uncharacterized protein LOC143862442 isoform X2 n=1 Tax=Tasmannia lanceolata TaxID=3420 RepID=UPI00406368ED
MDGIKEEALRLKGIAEQMIRGGDYNSARYKLNEAKQLFPVLENVSQVLTACNILCAAGIDFPNHGMDWYFILQLNPNDDEATIRTGYQMLCLDLEPIKDEFPGAKSALEYIDKAMSVLCNRAKRSVFDAKRKASWKSSGHAHSITASPSKKQKQTVGVHCKTKDSKVVTIREANEEAMNELPILVSHHTATPFPLPSKNQPQDSLQASLPTMDQATEAESPLQAESGDHSPNYSPYPSPKNPSTPPEIPPSDTLIDYIADLRQLILDKSLSSPEPQSPSSVQLESFEIQKAKKIVATICSQNHLKSRVELRIYASAQVSLQTQPMN